MPNDAWALRRATSQTDQASDSIEARSPVSAGEHQGGEHPASILNGSAYGRLASDLTRKEEELLGEERRLAAAAPVGKGEGDVATATATATAVVVVGRHEEEMDRRQEQGEAGGEGRYRLLHSREEENGGEEGGSDGGVGVGGGVSGVEGKGEVDKEEKKEEDEQEEEEELQRLVPPSFSSTDLVRALYIPRCVFVGGEGLRFLVVFDYCKNKKNVQPTDCASSFSLVWE